MTIPEYKERLLKNKKNTGTSFNQWMLVVAFISGVIFTACMAPVLTPGSNNPGQGSISPVKNTPGRTEQGFYPQYHPAQPGLEGLVNNISDRGLATG